MKLTLPDLLILAGVAVALTGCSMISTGVLLIGVGLALIGAARVLHAMTAPSPKKPGMRHFSTPPMWGK